MSFEGEELWADISQLSNANAYRRTDTEALPLELPQKFALSVADYFHDFYVDPPRLYRVSDVLNDREHRSNCHRFGAAVLSQCPQEFFNAYGIVAEIARIGDRQHRRALGSLAVLSTPENPFGFNHRLVQHTMVSLGSALPDQYLHTIALGGNLAISPLEPSLDSSKIGDLLPDVSTKSSPANLRPNPQAVDEARRVWRGSQ